MKIAYFDCFSGVSGDMCLGALVDCGVPLGSIKKHLQKLPLKGYSLSEKRVSRSGFSAVKVDVRVKSGARREHIEKRWSDIEKIIGMSSLPDHIRQKGLGIFRSLFAAEARVHGTTFDKVHLHELGAVDCVVDIFGTLIGLDILGIEAVYSSPLNLGGGTVKSAHGMLPVPAPATLELLKNVPVYSSGESFELTTPTGAALMKCLSTGFGTIPCMVPETIGVGAGNRDAEEMPNVLRVVTGSASDFSGARSVTVIETNIDDMNPQVYDYLIDLLFKKGALDVAMTPVIMKKMRPGTKLSVLCHQDKRDSLIQAILTESTSIGVRFYEASRVIQERQLHTVETHYGTARVKISGDRKAGIKITPEYEDCRKLAEKNNIPLLKIMEAVTKAAGKIKTSKGIK